MRFDAGGLVEGGGSTVAHGPEKWQLLLMVPSGDKRTYAVLLAIVVLGIGLRLYGYRGLWGTDDAEYALLANAMASGTYAEFVQANYVDAFNAPAQLPERLGMVVPLAALFRGGGVSEVTLALYPFLA